MNNLEKLQKEYNKMVQIAKDSDYNLSPAFELELFRLTQLLKSLGGKV